MNTLKRTMAIVLVITMLASLASISAEASFRLEHRLDLRVSKHDALRERVAVIRVSPPPLQPPHRWTEYDVAVLSRMVWGEGRGVSRNEQKLIVWTVLNRVDHRNYHNTIVGVVRARGQFHGYSSRHPVSPAIRDMTIEVLLAWDRGETAKVYPPFARTTYYLYFHGDGRHNWFRERWR